MGLDVYLYRYNDYEKTTSLENQYNEQSEKNWEQAGKYESLTDDQKEELRQKDKELAVSLGLNESGEDELNKVCIELPSTIDPEHYFKIGYFRSSYNSGGINSILRSFNLPTLSDIFEVNDRYSFCPDWFAALSNVNKLIEDFEKMPNFRCETISANMFTGATCHSKEQAMDIFLKEHAKKHHDEMRSYSNKEGSFYMDGLKVFGIIQGEENLLGTRPCAYIIYEGDNQWY